MNIIEKKKFEVEKLKELNFLVENQIKETDFKIMRTKKEISYVKSLEFLQEERREIFFVNNANYTFTNLAFKTQLKDLRKQFNHVTKEQKKNKRKIEDIKSQIAKMNYLCEKKLFTNRYINMQDIIVEDEFDYSEVISTHNNQMETIESVQLEENLNIRKVESLSLNNSPVKSFIPPLDLKDIEENKRKGNKKDNKAKEKTNIILRGTNEDFHPKVGNKKKSSVNDDYNRKK